MPYDRKDAEELVAIVLNKLDVSSEKYKDAYVLNDVTREVDEEIVDLVGWPLLQALRMRQAMRGLIVSADNIYWEKFLKNQTPEFLRTLIDKVTEELIRRNPGEMFLNILRKLYEAPKNKIAIEEGKQSAVDDLSSIANVLNDPEGQSLECEIILFALRHAQENPRATIKQCMDAGYNEWVK